MAKGRGETPAGRQSLVHGRDSAPQLRVQDGRRGCKQEVIVDESERPDVRDGSQNAAFNCRVRLAPGVEQSSGQVPAEVPYHRPYRRDTVIAPGRRRCHRYPTDRRPEG